MCNAQHVCVCNEMFCILLCMCVRTKFNQVDITPKRMIFFQNTRAYLHTYTCFRKQVVCIRAHSYSFQRTPTRTSHDHSGHVLLWKRSMEAIRGERRREQKNDSRKQEKLACYITLRACGHLKPKRVFLRERNASCRARARICL